MISENEIPDAKSTMDKFGSWIFCEQGRLYRCFDEKIPFIRAKGRTFFLQCLMIYFYTCCYDMNYKQIVQGEEDNDSDDEFEPLAAIKIVCNKGLP